MNERWLTGAKDECFLDLDTGQTYGPVIIGGESGLPQSMDLSGSRGWFGARHSGPQRFWDMSIARVVQRVLE